MNQSILAISIPLPAFDPDPLTHQSHETFPKRPFGTLEYETRHPISEHEDRPHADDGFGVGM